MNTKLRRFLSVAIAVLSLIAVFFAGFIIRDITRSKTAQKLEWAIELIEKNYVSFDEETGENKTFSVEDYLHLITGAFLDDYSTYYNSTEYAEQVRSSQGMHYGVGVSFASSSNDLTIFRIAGNSPAEAAGMIPGETIVAVSGENLEMTSVSNFEEFFAALEQIAEDGTVNIYVEGKTQPYTPVKSVYVESFVFLYDNAHKFYFSSDRAGGEPIAKVADSTQMNFLPDKTAYIALSLFSGGAAKQFGEAIEYAKTNGIEKIILDLRGNGGGYMDILCEIAAYLLDGDGKSGLTVTQSKGKTENLEYKTGKNKFFNAEYTVLADENTASASECLIGAMLCHQTITENELVISISDRYGVARTYGKGIMQSTFPSLRGDALKLTVAYVYWPDGVTCIHGKGIVTSEQNSVANQDALARAIEILN